MMSLISLQWPRLEYIKVAPLERICIDNFLKSAIPKILLKKFQICNVAKNQELKIDQVSWHLPISLFFSYDGQGTIKDVILLLNKKRGGVVGAGSQRAPKICFSLVHGVKVVKKSVCHNELPIIERLQVSPGAGLPKIFGLRHTQDKRTCKEKTQYFEEHCEGSLTQIIGKRELDCPHLKALYAMNLLEGLLNLQNQIVKTKINDTDDVIHPTFHRDLKPDNLLFEGYRALITDFGLSNVFHALVGTWPYMSPALVKNFTQETGDSVEFQLRHGNEIDDWALGLCLGTLLLNRFSDKPHLKRLKVPPLQVIEERLDPKKRIPSESLAFLSQREVDQEISELKRIARGHPQGMLLHTLWEIVGQFLQVSPSHPTCLKTAIDKLRNALVQSHPLYALHSRIVEQAQNLKTVVEEMKFLPYHKLGKPTQMLTLRLELSLFKLQIEVNTLRWLKS